MGALGVPDVLLAVGTENRAVVGDEVGHIVEEGGVVGAVVSFNDGSRDQADVEFFCQSLVVLEVFR